RRLHNGDVTVTVDGWIAPVSEHLSVDQIGVPRWTRASSLTSSAARSASSSRADRRLKPSGRLTPSPSPTSTRQDSQELEPPYARTLAWTRSQSPARER